MNWKGLARAATLGSGLLLLLFGLETALLWRSGAMGLNLETASAFAALFRAVRHAVPGLLLRIAALYAAAGAALFGASHLLVQWAGRPMMGLKPSPSGVFGPIIWGGWLLFLTVAHAGITRPALFDDLPWGQAFFRFLAEWAEPWQPIALGLLTSGAAVATGAVRRRQSLPGRWPWLAGLTAAALSLAVVAHAPESRSAKAGRPAGNPLVILLGIDAFRPDRLAVNGPKRAVAPNVDALVQDAVLFDLAYTPIAQTEPAWRSLLTARWPIRTGVRYPLTAEARWVTADAFPQVFNQAHYRTLFRTDCSRFHFEGASSGFEDRRQPPRGAVNFLLEKLRFRGVGIFGAHALGAWWLPEMVDNRALAGIHEPLGYAQRLSRELVEEAERGPLLFAFHATAAHFPGDARHPFYRELAEEGTPLSARVRMRFAPLSRTDTSSSVSRAQSEGLYDALIAQADAQVGILMQALQRSGLYDQALIILFSDHGESFYADRPDLQGAMPVHGARLSDEENRILLAIKLPKPQGRHRFHRVAELVRLIDVGPTLLELSGLPAMEDVDGESFVQALRGEPISPRVLYAETGFTHASPDVFNPQHLASARRSFDIYRVRADGVVEISDEAHQAILQDKDFGLFDGKSWVVEWKDRQGMTHHEVVEGNHEPIQSSRNLRP